MDGMALVEEDASLKRGTMGQPRRQARSQGWSPWGRSGGRHPSLTELCPCPAHSRYTVPVRV